MGTAQFGSVHFRVQTYPSHGKPQTDLTADVFANLERRDDAVYLNGSAIAFDSPTAAPMTRALTNQGLEADFAKDEALLKKKLRHVFYETGLDPRLKPPPRSWWKRLFSKPSLYRQEQAAYQTLLPLLTEKLGQAADAFEPRTHVWNPGQKTFGYSVTARFALPKQED